MRDALLTHCSTHMPDALHERTNELTNADLASKTENRSRVSNAHNRWIETDSGLARCPTCNPRAMEAS